MTPTLPSCHDSPLTFEGKRRLCERIDSGRPIVHVAAEAGVSRATLSKWYGRWREEGEAGLAEKSSRPLRSPAAIGDDIVDAILELRRAEKWGNARHGVSSWSRRRWMTPSRSPSRRCQSSICSGSPGVNNVMTYYT